MIIDTIKDLQGCVRDNYPCEYLRGYLSLKPLMVSCGFRGNECGRGYCCFYRSNNKTIDEIIKDEKGE